MCAKHSRGPSDRDGLRVDCDGVAHGGGSSDRAGGVDDVARSPLARLVERGILVYRQRISPAKGVGSCRFEPTCSAYGLEAVRRFGAIRGSWLTLLRIFRCAPWHPGGWDPVPREFPRLGSWWRRIHG